MTNDLFFDTECFSAFLWINDTNILHELYGGKIILPEPVRGEMIAPGCEAIKSLMLSNAIYLSSWEYRMVEIPTSVTEEEREF